MAVFGLAPFVASLESALGLGVTGRATSSIGEGGDGSSVVAACWLVEERRALVPAGTFRGFDRLADSSTVRESRAVSDPRENSTTGSLSTGRSMTRLSRTRPAGADFAAAIGAELSRFGPNIAAMARSVSRSTSPRGGLLS
jgi:hypothetical protein